MRAPDEVATMVRLKGLGLAASAIGTGRRPPIKLGFAATPRGPGRTQWRSARSHEAKAPDRRPHHRGRTRRRRSGH
jgi:hypothetical protein